MYEYKIITALTLKGLEKELNKQAAQGWRAVAGCHINTLVLEREKDGVLATSSGAKFSGARSNPTA